jgi:hypothetical protein
LLNLKAKHIVIGHTQLIIKGKTKRFGGKIWDADTAISNRRGGGFLSALIIKNGKFSRKYDF